MRSMLDAHAFAAAVQFLTRLPVPGGMNGDRADPSLLRAAVVHFPLVGGLVGAMTGGVMLAASHAWPPLVAAVVGLMVEAVVTGGFHEDAVADCCDAFGGGWTRDDVLRILKDSRVGSLGVLGLVLVVGLRATALAAVPSDRLIAASAASAALGRWAMLVMMRLVPAIPGREGLATDVAPGIGWPPLLGGTIFALLCLAPLAWLHPLRAAAGVAAVLAVTMAGARLVRRRLGGGTGDCYGAACGLGQCAALLATIAGAS